MEEALSVFFFFLTGAVQHCGEYVYLLSGIERERERIDTILISV